MEIIPRTVFIYYNSSGKSPFKEWLRSVREKKVRLAIRMRLDRLLIGNFGDYRNLSAGIYELRIHIRKGYRIYFGKRGQVYVILLCGGDKSTQKRDIKKAREYWLDLITTKLWTKKIKDLI